MAVQVSEETAAMVTGAFGTLYEVRQQLSQTGHTQNDPRVDRLLEEAQAKIKGAMERIYRAQPDLAARTVDLLNRRVLIVDNATTGTLAAYETALVAYAAAGHPAGGARRLRFERELARLLGVACREAGLPAG